MIYFTGDVHGAPDERVQICKNFMRDDDILFFAGDIGVPWGIKRPNYAEKQLKNDKSKLDYINDKPGSYVFIMGNHDDYNWADSCPVIHKWGTTIKQAKLDDKLYDNIYVIDDVRALTIDDKNILCLPFADSHDIKDGILDPQDIDFKDQLNYMYRNGKYMFRIKDWSWWEKEHADTNRIQQYMDDNDLWNNHYDYIISHDAPAIFNKLGLGSSYYRLESSEYEYFLDSIRKCVVFKYWLHGHMHQDFRYPDEDYSDGRLFCIYQSVLNEKGEVIASPYTCNYYGDS